MNWRIFMTPKTPLSNNRNTGDVYSALCNTSFCHMGTLGVQLKLKQKQKPQGTLLRRKLGSFHQQGEKAVNSSLSLLFFCYHAKSEWTCQCHFPRLCSEEVQQLSNQLLPGDFCLNSSWKATRLNVVKSFIRRAAWRVVQVCVYVRTADCVTGGFQQQQFTSVSGQGPNCEWVNWLSAASKNLLGEK